VLAEYLGLGAATAADVRAEQPRVPSATDRQTATQEFVVRRKVNYGLTIAGALMVSVPYVMGVPSAFMDHMQGGSAWMLVPVVGPFAGSLVVNHSGYQCDFVAPPVTTDCNSPLFIQVLWFDSIVQTSGAVLLTWGLIGRPTVERKDFSAWLAPAMSPGAAGLRLFGVF
jgi:hypothetical protein